MAKDTLKPVKGELPTGATPPPASGWYLVSVLLLVVLASWYLVNTGPQPKQFTYTEFKQQVSQGKVASVTLTGDQITGKLQQDKNKQKQDSNLQQSHRFVSTLPPVNDPELLPLLEKHNVIVKAVSDKPAWWANALVWILPWALIIGLFWYGSRKMQSRMAGEDGVGGIFGFGKSRAKRFTKGQTDVTYDDVAGLEHAKSDLAEISGYLGDPDRYRRLGAKVPKGILLMGPPGTGKTLLARAVAGEAGVPFFSISGSEFIEMFVGVGASRVRDMFDSAKKSSPSIIFIDEIDSVGRARGTGLGGGHDEREQTLNQILGEMDGFSPHEAVVVLAATNRPDVLDPALMRPGRFDRKVTLDLPDRKARQAIIKIHSGDVPLSDDVDMERLAALTAGFAGADLENLVNEAALLAGRENRDQVDMATFLNARDKLVLGGKRELVMSYEEKRLIAYHESGHAVVASLLPHADPPDKVTIIPRGRALGATEQLDQEERHNLQEDYLQDRLGVMLGGRVSEQLVYDKVSTGAEQDLKQATRLAHHMVAHWGMSDRLGPVGYQRGEEHIFLGREMAQQRDYSEHTAQLIDDEVSNLLRDTEQRVYDLLKAHQTQLDQLASALLEQETLETDELQKILKAA